MRLLVHHADAGSQSGVMPSKGHFDAVATSLPNVILFRTAVMSQHEPCDGEEPL